MIENVSADLQIDLLTPIWTAGHDPQQMDRIEETGFIGSLRWWHFILFHDSWNCKCEVKKKGDEKKTCPTCYLFGTTGWRRRFNLSIEGDEGNWPRLEKVPGNKKSWFIPLARKEDGSRVLLRIINNGSQQYKDALGELFFLLKFVSRFGSIGGKRGAGNGVFSVSDNEHFNFNAAMEAFLAKHEAYFAEEGIKKSIFERDFFFIEFNFTARQRINERTLNHISPAVRGYLRGEMRVGSKDRQGIFYGSGLTEMCASDIRHELMGQKGMGSSIIVSNPYQDASGQYRFRIYGLVKHKHRESLPILFGDKKESGDSCSLNLTKWRELVTEGINKKMRSKLFNLNINDAICLWDYENIKDFLSKR